MRRLMQAATLVFGLASVAGAQAKVTIRDLGPGAGGRILRDALTRPHRLVEPGPGWFVLGPNEEAHETIIVLGRSAAISGKVTGEVIVVGGDLFVRPGGDISERAVAIGGGVYPSALAHVAKGTRSFYDNTFAIIRTPDGFRLEYRSLREHASPPLLFPGIYGLRMLAYDRVNGVSVPFGPSVTFGDGRGELNALATYRSDLGKIDPSIAATLQISRRLRGRLSAARGTFSNDDWIWSNLVNSLSVLVFGADTRNYHRADRGEATVHRLLEWSTLQIEPFVGARDEHSWSVGPGLNETRGPWSILGRTDSLGIRRPNPAIDPGAIVSVLAGTSVDWVAGGVTLHGRSEVEKSVAGSALSSAAFAQVTSDVAVDFLTFGEQEYGLDIHWVTGFGDTPPRQRFAYLGGSGTLPFNDLLDQGGDRLLLIDQRYAIPLKVRLGMFGTPTLQLRHRIGSAGVGELPAFGQILGFGVMLTFIRGEVQMDPLSGKVRASAGFSFSR